MEFKTIKFKDAKAQRVYNNYITSLENTIKNLPKENRTDVLMEFNSHIYESLQKSKDSEELTTLLDAIDKLGAPDIVLKPLIAQKAIEKATRTFNPIHVARAISLNIANGFYFTIYGCLYLGLFSFVFLVFAELFNPSNTGIFYKNNQFEAFGLIPNINGLEEVSGNWFIPIMLLLTIVFYVLITLSLKLRKSIINK